MTPITHVRAGDIALIEKVRGYWRVGIVLECDGRGTATKLGLKPSCWHAAKYPHAIYYRGSIYDVAALRADLLSGGPDEVKRFGSHAEARAYLRRFRLPGVHVTRVNRTTKPRNVDLGAPPDIGEQCPG